MVQIREFVKEDTDKVIDMIRKDLNEVVSKDTPSFAIEQLLGVYTSENFPSVIADKKFFVAVEGMNIVGTVSLKENVISTFFINPEFAEYDISGFMLKHVEKIIKLQNYSHVKINSSITLKDYFVKHDYQIQSDMEMEGQTVSYLLIKGF